MAKEIVERFDNASSTSNIVVKENEYLTLITFNDGSKVVDYDSKITLEAGATLKVYNVVTSDKDVNMKEEIILTAPGANCEIINVLLTVGKAKLNVNTMIRHNAHHTESDFSNYAIAKDESFMVLDNNAKIEKASSKSVVHQKAKGLTLSKTAKIKAMPNLYIDEYDVVANHAASIGSINKEDLFYLMSRGLSEAEASKLIVIGFVQPLLDRIDNENLKREISENFTNKL